MKSSQIQWTDHTFNPWWGCEKVSPGCKHCYAEQFADKRLHLKVWGAQAERRIASEKTWADPLKWNAEAAKEGKRARVFCASMADVFEKYEGPSQDAVYKARLRLWHLIAATPHLDWLLLTKRPQNVLAMVPGAWMGFDEQRQSLWPANVWIGCTVENQEEAKRRLPHLLKIPSRVRFVSYEPALEPVDFSRWLWPVCNTWDSRYPSYDEAKKAGAMAIRIPQRMVRSWMGLSMTKAEPLFVDWIIVGGESGGSARPFNPVWADNVVTQCREAETAVFVKQMGTNPIIRSGSGWGPITAHKGDNPDEWPQQLRVREFPHGATK